MDQLDELLRRIKEGSEERLNEIISKGTLKLTDEQIATVSFGFWMVYMAEIDLNDSLRKAWKLAKSQFPENVQKIAEQKLSEMINESKITCPTCGTRYSVREININDPEYFSDKIKIFQASFGKTKLVKLLWQLNDIRNNLSHNRIDRLEYDGFPLSQRGTKEKLICDYIRMNGSIDSSESEIWNKLSDEDKQHIEILFMKAVDERDNEHIAFY